MKKFNSLFWVKSSLISLYLALTIPIPFISIEKFKVYSIILFILGLILIIDITNDYVETCDKKITYKSSFTSKLFGKKGWQIFWKDIKSIKSLSTSQGSKVFYFTTNKNENFLVPQRLENLEIFFSIVLKNTDLKVKNLSYISPLWTYKLLTYISILMVVGEILTFSI